jgi:methionyl-tRNA formyltransferase
MNIVFCGTPAFAVPALQALLDSGDITVKLVVAQPDRRSGRGLEVATAPVKQLALHRHLPLAQPEKIKLNPEFQAQLEDIRPDAIVVVAYGRIIPAWMLALPPLGNINLHASLLPRYRGAAPIQWAVAQGETVTGVTTMRIDAGLDTGDILLQRELPIASFDTTETLSPRLAALGAPLIVETLRGLANHQIKPRPQDNHQATLAPLLARADGQIDWHRSSHDIYNRMRGFQPWPGVFSSFRGKKLTVLDSGAVEDTGTLANTGSDATAGVPGTIVTLQERLLVICGHRTALELFRVQPEGKREMSAADLIHGYRPQTGETFGS